MHMNKIIVDQKNLKLQDEAVIIEQIKSDTNIEIVGNVSISVFDFSNKTLHLSLKKNSSLLLECFVAMECARNEIYIDYEEGACLDLHYACTYKQENELVIFSHVESSNTTTNIQVRSVDEGGSLVVKAVGEIVKDTKENAYLEDIKALINEYGSVTIFPDLLVSSDSVIANHNATISPVDEGELFYLESQGISYQSAVSLLKKGFLMGIMSDQFKKDGGDKNE